MRYLPVVFFGVMIAALISIPDFSFAHSGRSALDSCHYDKETGVRHCHGNSSLEANQESSKQPVKSTIKVMSEAEYNKIFCAEVGGKTEITLKYPKDEEQGRYPKGSVRVDCETSDSVYEGGLDNQDGSLNNLQQAVFYSVLTGKEPVVVIYDTNGKWDKIEYKIMKASKKVGVRFLRVQYYTEYFCQHCLIVPLK